jgi:hypothetical protein
VQKPKQARKANRSIFAPIGESSAQLFLLLIRFIRHAEYVVSPFQFLRKGNFSHAPPNEILGALAV